jgi:octaprenyl-diphosphate synthase
MILKANQSVEYWLVQADQLIKRLPLQLQAVAQGLVASVALKTTFKSQGHFA